MDKLGAATKSPGEIKLLRRYQRNLMLCGGIALSLALLCGACLAVWADIRSYIADSRAIYVANKALVTQEMEKKHAAMQRGVIYSELLWKNLRQQSPKKDSNASLAAHTQSGVVSQLQIERRQQRLPGQSASRFVEFSEQLAYALTASVWDEGGSFAGYFLDPQLSFLSIASPPYSMDVLRATSQAKPEAVIGRLAPDIGNLNDPAYTSALHASRRVFWFPPMTDPLTGETVLRVAAPAFDGDRPFVILVSNIAFDVLPKWLRQSNYRGNFTIIDQSGELIMSSWDRSVTDPRLTARVLESGIWRERLDSSDYVYRDGIFSFSEPLGDTGWVFAYAHSWRTVWAARGAFVSAYVAGMVLLLSLLWSLIFFYLEKVLKPLWSSSQQVFDSEQLSRTIIATVPNGLCLISMHGGQVVLKNAVMQSYDCQANPLAGQLLALYRNDAGASCPDSGGVGHVYMLSIDRDDGRRRELVVEMVATHYMGEAFLLCSFSDITEQKQLEASLRDARVAADVANNAKSAFLATMSHEIRTPLNGILGNLELLAYTALTDLQKDRLQIVTKSSRELLEIINDILDFSKIESGQMYLEDIAFDLVDLIEQAISIFLVSADEKGLDLYYRVAPDFPRWIMGDPTRLRQIVVNLLSNAIKFTEHGSVSLLLTAEASPDGAKNLVLRVVDTGIGISTDRYRKLFRPFEQGDVSVARRYGGTGLGLSLCAQLVQMMAGQINAESVEGEGSEFVVLLPLRAVVCDTSENDIHLPEAVFLLADDVHWRAHVTEQLQAWGVSVQVLKRPEEGRGGGKLVLIFGSERSWSVASEACLFDNEGVIVDGREHGPRHPVTQDKRILLSCYSLNGLRCALLMANDSVMHAAHEDKALSLHVVSPPDGAQGVNVLVVEDHSVSRELIYDQLSLLGYAVSLAENAGQALQLYCKDEFDIVLTDLSMPGTDGYMLARMLREQGAKQPIIAITANASIDERKRCRAAGIDDVLIKPMSLKELERIVRRYLSLSVSAGSGINGSLSKQGHVPISKALLLKMKSSTEELLREIHIALVEKNKTQFMERMHALRGAFAMQRKFKVVNACRKLERDFDAGMGTNIEARMSDLESLTQQSLLEIEKNEK